jgi:hypothetical protein
MNSYLPQSFVRDHIRESRQQAAAARQARQARQTRSVRFRAGTHARQVGHRMAGGA